MHDLHEPVAESYIEYDRIFHFLLSLQQATSVQVFSMMMIF